MASAQRISVYALFIGIFANTQSVSLTASAKDNKDGKSVANNVTGKQETEFQWQDHGKLSWEDFRGPVHAENDESAAATHCGLGFRVNSCMPGKKPDVVVYNTFYVNKSWVRPDAKIASILDHEQGHFDLCEIYTRMLRTRMANIEPGTDVKTALMRVFNDVNNLYERRQQEYENETVHGTEIPVQKKWQRMISDELSAPGALTASAR